MNRSLETSTLSFAALWFLAILMLVTPTRESRGNQLSDSCDLGKQNEDGSVEFLVYFDLDKAHLSKNNFQIVKNAAKCATERNASSVMVIGHTDQVGSEIYNLKLSRKRANIVVATLRQNAVATGIISVDWKGKFEPAITGGSIKPEPLNRRAVITIIF